MATLQEATIQKGAARYRRASETGLSARETELAAFSAVIRGLREAAPGPARIRALGQNHDLWSALVKDMALAGNRMPDALKAELIQLGAWSMRYSTLAILNNLPVEPLIAVNSNIADGLAAQQQPAPGVGAQGFVQAASV